MLAEQEVIDFCRADAANRGLISQAVIEAVGLTEDGQIIPSTAVYDAPEWIENASSVIVEINLKRPLALEGVHDIYGRGPDPIPLIANVNSLKRIGVPYFPVDPKKIKAIVISDLDDKPSRDAKPSEQGAAIGGHLVEFFRKEIAASATPAETRTRLVAEYREKLDQVAERLLDVETLTREEFEAIFPPPLPKNGGTPLPLAI